MLLSNLSHHASKPLVQNWLIVLGQPLQPLSTSGQAAGRKLLNFDFRTGFFKDVLDFSRFFFANAFLNSLRRAFNEILGFFQAKTGDRANFLDHVDLVSAAILKNDRELGLFFSCSSSSRHRGSCHGGRSTNAKLGLEFFYELSSLEQREIFQELDYLFFCYG